MKYFSMYELTRSTTAEEKRISNTPNHEQKQNLITLTEECLDKVRELWGRPLSVNSGFRSKEVNRLVGGATTSQHCKGEAADITTGSSASNKELFDKIVDSDILFDQLIDERGYRWLHISYRKGSCRKQILHL